MQLDTINDRSTQLIDRIGTVKETAASSESLVKTGCTEIRKLDTAKKNLTFSITALKRLIMLRKFIFAAKPIFLKILNLSLIFCS